MKISNLYILLFTLFIFACYSSKSKVKKNQKKETLELEPIVNSQFYKYIDQYDKESIYEKDEQVVAVIFEKKIRAKRNIYYLRRVNAISFIYAYPITGYMLYKNKPILVYSKEDGFRDVATYGKNSIDYLKKHIYNDMIHYRIYDSIDKKYYLTNSLKNIGDHPPIWKIKNNSLLKKRWAIDLEKEKLVKFNDNGDGIYYTTKTIISIDSIK